MAKESKPYKRNNVLTHQQETFCIEVAKGKTQTEAYRIAYPKSKNWTKEAVWVQSSILNGKEKIQDRIDELKEDTQKDVTWTRKQVLANLNYLLLQYKGNIQQKKRIYQDILDDKYKELTDYINAGNTDDQEINKMKNEIREIQLKENISPSDVKGMLSVIQEINKMQGYNTPKQEIQEEDTEREELKNNLTIEELRQLVYGKDEQ